MKDNIRKMTQADSQAMFELAAYAFNSEKTEMRKKRFDWLVDCSANYGCFEDDQLTAQIIATPFTIDFHGTTYKMSGIGSVSSYPEYRGQGNISALMKQILFDLKTEKTALSYLAPFSYPFYRRYGYEQLFEQIEYKISSRDWPQTPLTDRHIYRCNWEEAKPAITSIYEQWLAENPGGVVREDWWLDYKFSLGKDYRFAIVENPLGKVEGYLVYEVTVEQFVIHEWLALNQKSYTALAGFIGSHSGATHQFYYKKGFSGEQLSYLMPSPLLEIQIQPYMMGRIVDFESFIEAYPFIPESTEATFYLELQDDYGPWNNGIWQLIIKDGKTTIKKDITPTAEIAGKILHANIQGWTQFFMGYASGKKLHFHEIITGEAKQIEYFDQFIPEGKPVLEDYF
ncbi:putative acetyltransferase [Enterococcus sp. PF1-24]|uniref:GNAT family N-acetyltransferase n=1 Tax=unclassified Enterococcus TaxID=2608891 RepID=UPI0024758046|nr:MULTISPECIES: GNAT family N-acetyltransferase [unclassified Enterococcus]MDH6364467.1 putative acetyltransferase [Enterococcus sp. PFB1-1]MDH6401510.1 putative acetyltransferase [Enterococcus sp. PF1-24]